MYGECCAGVVSETDINVFLVVKQDMFGVDATTYIWEPDSCIPHLHAIVSRALVQHLCTCKANAMKKNISLLLILLPAFGFSQGILGKVKQRAQQTVENRVLNKAEAEVNKGLDKAEGKKTETKTVADNTTDNTDTDEAPAQKKDVKLKQYSRYDFVPGESVFYFADFNGQPIGELPVGWNSNGSAVLVTLEGIEGSWLRLPQRTVTLTDNKKEMGEDFTLEFDVVMQYEFNGWLPPHLQFGLFASGEKDAGSNDYLNEPYGLKTLFVTINPAKDGRTTISMQSYNKRSRYFNGPAKAHGAIEQFYGKPLHVAMQAQKERMRVWVNGDKVFDIPKAIPVENIFNQLFFQLESSAYADEQVNVYVGNFKMARGLPDTRHKLAEEGKFSTTGILFESNKAAIKPESSGVLAEIAGVLNKYPELKVKIIGHTDSDGSDEANQKLSERRAEAVKEALVNEYKVSEDRLQTAGKGEKEPVEKNDTQAGKAQNRRVEFLKL